MYGKGTLKVNGSFKMDFLYLVIWKVLTIFVTL
jgi:hypothetical protein